MPAEKRRFSAVPLPTRLFEAGLSMDDFLPAEARPQQQMRDRDLYLFMSLYINLKNECALQKEREFM